MKSFTLDELNKKSIFEVRALAKDYGVSAPTKLNKAELVDLIYKISNGAMEPPQAPHRGRPKKQTSGASETDSQSGASSGAATTDKTENAEQRKPFKIDNNLRQFDKRDKVGSFAEDKKVSRFESNVKPQRNFDDIKPKFHTVQRDQNSRRNDYTRPNLDFTPASMLAESRTDEIAEQIREGYLEINPDGYGFLRVKNGEFNEMDAYVSAMKIKQFGLRRGDYVRSLCKTMQEGKPAAVISVTHINGMTPQEMGKRPNFDEMVPIYPNERIRLELANQPREYAIRCIDLVSPIGKGQRGIIVSPPKAGKTTLLKMIASSIAKNYPEIELKVLLIDERPEEVTDMERSIKGEVVSSTFDELPEHHTKTAEMLLDRAKRLVEMGKDVVILLDSLTRLARAYNLTIQPTGRTLSGGIDPGALHSPKRFFGSARNLENGGSLTIIATALIDTGSRMDDVIFEEFKGTGNMEIHLDRALSEKRIFPAIDLAKSGTRKEELLLTPAEMEGTWGIRRLLSSSDNSDATSNLINMIIKTTSNKEFIEQLNLQLKVYQKEGFTLR